MAAVRSRASHRNPELPRDPGHLPAPCASRPRHLLPELVAASPMPHCPGLRAALPRAFSSPVRAGSWSPMSIGSDAVASTSGLWLTPNLSLHHARSPPHRRNVGEAPSSVPVLLCHLSAAITAAASRRKPRLYLSSAMALKLC
jgi:hypothetical protein